MTRRMSFNPRPREGGDLIISSGMLVGIAVSIHAPAKGATSTKSLSLKRDTSFNPRPREGGDGLIAKFIVIKTLSNVYREPWAFAFCVITV